MPASRPVVLDASIVIATLLPEAGSLDAEATLEQGAADGILVPALWWLEVANVAMLAERRGKVSGAVREAWLGGLGQLRIGTDHEAAPRAWHEVTRLALRHGLTTYDASYLDLAIRSAGRLGSFDRALRRAAAAEGIMLLPA